VSTPVEQLISGLTNVEATLRKRYRDLDGEVRIVEGEMGRLVKRRDALYKELDQARKALTAIGALDDEEPDCD